jgi:hypothetical protein
MLSYPYIITYITCDGSILKILRKKKTKAKNSGDAEIHGKPCAERNSKPCCCLFRNPTQDKKELQRSHRGCTSKNKDLQLHDSTEVGSFKMLGNGNKEGLRTKLEIILSSELQKDRLAFLLEGLLALMMDPL